MKTEITIKIVKAVAAAIKDLGNVPSGHLYAQLMAYLTLDQYNTVIGFLKKEGLVREDHHELQWIA